MRLEDIVGEMLHTGVRRMRRGETIPATLDVGIKGLDENWVWVSLVNGRIVAALVASPCHSLVFLVRLVVEPGHARVLPRLLRAFIRDVKERGFTGYLTYLDKERIEELRIMRILQKTGKVYEHPSPQTLIGGELADLEKW